MKMKVAQISSLFLLLMSSALSEEELYPCEQDATGRFYVDGTEGNGMRYCQWAAREHTEERCQIQEVAWQCPITCQVPCIDLGDGLAIGANVAVESDSILQSQISSSSIDEYDDTIPETVIVIFSFIILSAVVTFIIIKQKERQVAARSWEDDDERVYVVSDVNPVRTW